MVGKPGAGGKMGAAVEKMVLPVETDPHKLVNYVCGSNIYLKGEDVKVSKQNLQWAWNFNQTSEIELSARLNLTDKSHSIDRIQIMLSFRLNQTRNTPTGFGAYTPDHRRN